MKRLAFLFSVILPLFLAGQQPIIIDHTCLDLDQIPDEYIDSAKANLWIGYGHTSHGSQLASGMNALEDYFTDGTYDWSHDGGPGELHLYEGEGGYLSGDCGTVGWDNETREYLDDFPGCNVIIWSWCGQVNDVDLPSHYFDPMEQLELDYPDVQFVYMTGHLEGLGPGGSLYLANQQIRDYCIANNKILYDFADIEKYSPDADTNYQDYWANDACNYNPPGGGTANWANNWLAANPGHELTQISQLCSSCAHSVSLNCTKKGIASWFLWARLAGWNSQIQITSNFNMQDTAIISHTVDITYTGNASDTATYYWDFDGANILSGSGQGPYIVQWSGSGDKTVSLYVEESGFVSNTTTNNIYIEYLTSDFLLPDTACRSCIVEIIYTGNASDTATYYWDFDGANVISGSGQGPYMVEWPTDGDKTVSLYVEEAGYITDTTSKNIYIVFLTSDFQLQDTACIAHTVDIIYTGNAAPSATYYWEFDGATIISGSGQGPYTVQWPSPGDKTVSLYVEESNFVSDTTTNSIYIEYLTSDFQLQDFACIFNTVVISYIGNASDSATYYWDFDNANIVSGSGQGPFTVQWLSNGNKTVSLYVEESGYVSDTSSNEISIFDNPVFTIIPYPDDTVTTLDTIVLMGDVTSVSYLWSTGDTTQSIEVTCICGSNGGSQDYWLEVTNEGGCSSTEYITVVFEGPTLLSELPGKIDIKVYPNPFSDNLNIELRVFEKGQYIFEVFDCIGLTVFQELRHLKPGKQKISIDMNHGYPGVYILSVKSDDGQLGVKKVIKSSH